MLGRRAMLKLSFAGASVLALGQGSNLLAADKKPTIKVLKEAESEIPGYAKVRQREATWQPGDGVETRPMKNDMVCEMTSGSLETVVDGTPVTRNKGDVWTCKKGMMISDLNEGTTPAVMRVLDLLPE